MIQSVYNQISLFSFSFSLMMFKTDGHTVDDNLIMVVVFDLKYTHFLISLTFHSFILFDAEDYDQSNERKKKRKIF